MDEMKMTLTSEERVKLEKDQIKEDFGKFVENVMRVEGDPLDLAVWAQELLEESMKHMVEGFIQLGEVGDYNPRQVSKFKREILKVTDCLVETNRLLVYGADPKEI